LLWLRDGVLPHPAGCEVTGHNGIGPSTGFVELHTWSCSNLSEVRGRVATLSRATSDVLAF